MINLQITTPFSSKSSKVTWLLTLLTPLHNATKYWEIWAKIYNLMNVTQMWQLSQLYNTPLPNISHLPALPVLWWSSPSEVRGYKPCGGEVKEVVDTAGVLISEGMLSKGVGTAQSKEIKKAKTKIREVKNNKKQVSTDVLLFLISINITFR